jgi:hypothetical protein
MNMRLPRRSLLLLGVALVAAAATFAIASISNAAPKSTPLHGTFGSIANFFAPSCTSVTGICSSFSATGIINGDGVVFIDTPPDANGISQAHTVIHTNKGDLTCSEFAIFNLTRGDHPFVDLCMITGGTGRYAGASGYIQENGTFDFAANQGEADYSGKIEYGDG